MNLPLETYQNKEILITGGLGFIGSNLAIQLAKLGTKVSIVDIMLPRHGGNLFNVEEVKNKIRINFSDIRDELSMAYLVQSKDYIFHLAGQVNHVDSVRDPIKDLDINCRGTLVILEACRKHNKNAKVIFSGTRGQYGSTTALPVTEEHPMNPKGIYAITNLAAEKMILSYHQVHHINGVCLRITNTYGPRHQMRHDEYGVFNWFIRKAIDSEEINIFGDGSIVRDFLYVDDLVQCLLMVGLCGKSYGNVFNVGSGMPVSFLEIVKKIVEVTRSGRYRFTEFTQERKVLEPGDYYADIKKIKTIVGWQPRISLEDGIAKTVDFYRCFKEKYWP